MKNSVKFTLQCLIFLPALIGWIVFAPCFRVANYLNDKFKLDTKITKYGCSVWYWCDVEAKDHTTFYSGYDEYG